MLSYGMVCYFFDKSINKLDVSLILKFKAMFHLNFQKNLNSEMGNGVNLGSASERGELSKL
jgi:hypothetical protein